MIKRVERVSAPIDVNFDASPDEIVDELTAAVSADECPYCGDVFDEDRECSRKCPASLRARKERLG